MTLSSNSSFINELINISNEYVDSYMDDSSLNAPTSILKKKKSDLQKVKLDHILDYICFQENSIRADELAFNASVLLENSDTLKNKFKLWIKEDVNSYQ